MSVKIYAPDSYKKYFEKKTAGQSIVSGLDITVVDNGAIVIDPRDHGFGVFDEQGQFVKASLQMRKNNGQFIPKVPENMPYVDDVWGCELLDGPDKNGDPVISEVLYTIDNTTKTRAIFEINKGIGKIEDIEVNSKIPEELRRVHFENMIYIADGPSDIPAFSVVKRNGGATFAIYPKGDKNAMKQVEQMREDGRVDMYAEADYSEGTTAHMWIINRIQKMADRIRDTEKAKIMSSASGVPKHLV